MKEKGNFYWYLTRDKLGEFVGYLGFIGVGLLVLFLIGQKTKANDLELVTGRFERISYEAAPKGSMLDFIHLVEYPTKFQISYVAYNEAKFKETAKPGDIIKINIDKDDKGKLTAYDSKIRGFSLELNGERFLGEDQTVSSLSTTNKALLIIGIILIMIFGLYSFTKYNDWKRL